MSFDSYRKAMELVEDCEDFEIGEGVSEEYLASVEERLGVMFSPIHRDFLLNYGYMCFCGYEIFGIAEDTPEDAVPWGNLLLYTLAERERANLPTDVFPVTAYDDGCIAYLDYEFLTDGEPKVIVAIYNGAHYITIDKNRAADLGDFLFNLVEKCL